MGSVFAVILAYLVCIWVYKKYHLWKAGHPLMHIFMMGCLTLFAAIAGNTVFKNGVPFLPVVNRWAYVDAFKDGIFGPSHLLFFGTLIVIAMLALIIFNFGRKVVLGRVQNRGVHTGWFILYLSTAVVLALALGMNLHGMRISLPSALGEPTSRVAYTAVTGGLDAGGNLITQIKTSVREQKVIVPNSVMAEYEASQGGQLEKTEDDEQVITKSYRPSTPRDNRSSEGNDQEDNPSDHQPAIEREPTTWQSQDEPLPTPEGDGNGLAYKQTGSDRPIRYASPDKRRDPRQGPDED